MMVAQWNGSSEEAEALRVALGRYCAAPEGGDTCQFNADGMREKTCTAHKMLLEDQRALDGLVFVRRIAARLRAEEMQDGIERWVGSAESDAGARG